MIELLRQAQDEAAALGYGNILQPGLAKEMVIASLMGHQVHDTKHDADAWEIHDPTVKYEYLTCYEGGSFQMDRMFKAPADKRERSLERVTRNAAFYCAVFRKGALAVDVIYRIPTADVLAEVERQLDASGNDISHIGLSIAWTKGHGEVAYRSPA